MEQKTLQDAFAIFSREASRLENSYTTLKTEYEKLHEKLETIVSHLTEGLIFISLGGIISIFNPAAARYLDLAQEEILGKNYWDCFEDLFFGFSMQNGLKEERRTLHSLTHNDHDLELSSSMVPKKGLLLLLRDVTELRQLEQALEQNDRLKELGGMAAVLAHEIRNPLGGIEGFASILFRDLEEKPEQREMASSIINGTRALNRLVSNVLHFAKPLELHFVPTNLCEAVEEVCALVKAEGKSCTITGERKELSLSLDRDLFKMALLNIVRNGLQASSSGVSIEIDDEAIRIMDDGEGIPEENLEKIFTPFFTTKSSGTGLGLAETAKIIQAHGGMIEVESKVGAGTTFIIKLPRVYGD